MTNSKADRQSRGCRRSSSNIPFGILTVCRLAEAIIASIVLYFAIPSGICSPNRVLFPLTAGPCCFWGKARS